MLSNGTFNTVRIRFAKEGRARYISHLDLNRTMTRAVRRAHIPLWYTEGFNRHPYITFAAPLSLGLESECECMDLRLEQAMDMAELCRKMNEVMPEGLTVLSAAPAVKKAGELGFARYRMTVSCPQTQIEAFLAQPSIVVQKKSKKGELRELDIKNAFQNVSLCEAAGVCEWEMTLPCSSAETVNPSLVGEALRLFCGDEPPIHRVRRLELYALDGTVFA